MHGGIGLTDTGCGIDARRSSAAAKRLDERAHGPRHLIPYAGDTYDGFLGPRAEAKPVARWHRAPAARTCAAASLIRVAGGGLTG